MTESRMRTARKKNKRDAPPVSDAQARKTALVVAAVLALIAFWNLFRGRETLTVTFATISLSLAFIRLLVPVAARGFHRFWMGVARVLGYINSRILLSFLYYGMFTPYGFISRLMGRDPLRRREAGEETFWVKREYSRQTKEQFERLF